MLKPKQLQGVEVAETRNPEPRPQTKKYKAGLEVARLARLEARLNPTYQSLNPEPHQQHALTLHHSDNKP